MTIVKNDAFVIAVPDDEGDDDDDDDVMMMINIFPT